MHQTTSSAESAISGILDRWADAIARHAPEEVADLFAEDALFQGFDPTPGFGQSYVAAYYDKQPAGLTASYELVSARMLGPEVLVGYARVAFDRPDGLVEVYLTVVLHKEQDRWRIAHYHVSRTAVPH